MVPAVAIISLIWVLSCLTLDVIAVPNSPTHCCRCETLKPIDIPGGRMPQILPSPFKIVVEEPTYVPNVEVHVNLESTTGESYRSFFLGAYVAPYKDGDKPIGQLTLLPNQGYTVKSDCYVSSVGTDSSGHALISQDDTPKTRLRFVWKTNKLSGHIEFRATFVVNDDIFWVSEKSNILADPTSPQAPKQFTAPINTDQCGISKGCFREPADCIEPQCLYILTWRDDNNKDIELELGGLADGASDRYVAFALSDDKYMGDDTVFTCAHNSASQKTEVFLSYNTADPKKNNPIPKYDYDDNIQSYYDKSLYAFISHEEGSYENGRLRCRFKIKRDIDTYNSELRAFRGGPSHLLFAHGFANKGSPKRHGLSVEKLPLASASAVDFSKYDNASGKAKYHLAKAHGCLMILAWVFFASIGLILTKYYKSMWPNNRIFEQKYWFFGHFNCMATMFIITIIAIILIFVEAGGYSEAPDLPQKAHPILGIIILICIIINPIIALIRPAEDNKCRPVFNWFHWAFGTIANVLAIPQIFIGMDFGKVGVPWWATWILVIWAIFHIVVELSLEIHQCCTYKKNKERRKKWEQLKREYPKQHHPEPEPAGRRFKRFMLFLHIGITALITLIMIIIIAVS